MLEVEAKAYLEDPERVMKELIDLGAREMYFTVQRDTYYLHPGRDFGATDEALRIREEQGRAFITYKGPKLDDQTKSREELEVPLVDPRPLGTLLLRLGFEPSALKWSIEVNPGDASLVVNIRPEFEAMKDPHDPKKPISRDQLAELVQGSTTVSGSDSLEGANIKADKVPLMED